MKSAAMGWSIALVVVATFGFVAMFAIEAEISSRDLRVAEGERRDSESQLSKTTEALERMNDRVAQASLRNTAKAGAANEVETLEKSIQRKNQEIADKTAAWQKVRDDFQGDLELARKSAIGSKLKDVRINGILFETVTVTSVNAGTISFATDSGVHKVGPEKAPAELADRLKLTWNPQLKTTPTLLKEDTGIVKNGEPAPSEDQPIPPEEPPPSAAPAQKEPVRENPVTAELTKATNELAALATNIKLGEATFANRSQACQVLESSYQMAKARGKIVSVSPELAQARKAVETIMNQLAAARQQYAALTKKVRDLSDKQVEWERKSFQSTP